MLRETVELTNKGSCLKVETRSCMGLGTEEIRERERERGGNW